MFDISFSFFCLCYLDGFEEAFLFVARALLLSSLLFLALHFFPLLAVRPSFPVFVVCLRGSSSPSVSSLFLAVRLLVFSLGVHSQLLTVISNRLKHLDLVFLYMDK
ncbi:hypothetical protein Csa_003155 [Cucumis sativus]|uniref:Transmembrane protein n=1 Tax=Cucumis sativus TaxID=3659 RepID=A0A0A0KHL2_CUCSA|nr:hypothetical protein Csa_003155 [Cucumis sativus]